MRRALIALLGLAAACGSVGTAEESPTTPVPTPRPTVPGVGELPDTIPAVRGIRDEPLVVITRPVTREGVLVELVGDRVGGNRLLLIGDSIFAGTARRYGGEMCAGLVPLGWAVAVEAEAGRFVEFGAKVVGRLVPEATDTTTTRAPAGDEDWDAAAVFLGSNYNGDRENFEAKMRTILDRLAPRPTLLYTVTEYREDWAEVNEVIAELGEEYANVTIIDWEEVARTPGVLMADGLHPGDEGEQVLVELTAAALGRAQVGDGECLRETFRDDSAIGDAQGTPNTGGSSSSSRGSTSGGSSGGSGGSSGGGSSATTNPPSTPPRTTSPGTTSPGTTSPGTTSPGTTSPGTTSPGTTSPGTTSPGTTSPATTAPPVTQPPPTPPPVTQPPVTPPPAPPTTSGP